MNTMYLTANRVNKALNAEKIQAAVIVYNKNNTETKSYTNPLFPTEERLAVFIGGKEGAVKEWQKEAVAQKVALLSDEPGLLYFLKSQREKLR